MKKTKFTALALALVMGIGALSGCSDETELQMEYVDAGALANASLPQISAVELENGGGNPNAADSSDPEAPSSDSLGSTQPSGNSAGTSSPANSSSGAPTESKTAEIVIPNVSEYGVYFVECEIFDPEKVKSVLLGDVDITPEIRDYSKDDPHYPYPIYDWKNDSVSLYVNNNNSPSFNLLKDQFTLARTMFLPPQYNTDGAIEYYEHINDELDFCTREQAVKNVKETLNKIGITVSGSADVYTLSQGDLQKLVDEDIAAGRFYDPHTSLKDLNQTPLDSYTVDKSQECYYIVFRQEHSGVPIYNLHSYYTTIKDFVIFHPDITAAYSADGLIMLSVDEYHGNITESEKVTQLITAESAAQAVTKKYSDMGASRVDFDKLELMYVFTPIFVNGKLDINKYKMIPAWVCTVHYTRWTSDRSSKDYGYVTSKNTVLINAMTGDEII